MGIDMYLEQSQLQSSSVATMCQSQVEAYQALQSAIQKFSEDTESLKGDAYNSADFLIYSDVKLKVDKE